jgi:hypothetical protein
VATASCVFFFQLCVIRLSLVGFANVVCELSQCCSFAVTDTLQFGTVRWYLLHP